MSSDEEDGSQETKVPKEQQEGLKGVTDNSGRGKIPPKVAAGGLQKYIKEKSFNIAAQGSALNMDALPYPVPQPDDMRICPYDSSHSIEERRMQYHLRKCRRQHSGQDFVTCHFNAKHEMPKVELRYHHTVCPDRARIKADIEYEATKNSESRKASKGCTDVPSYEYDFEVPQPSEDWDAETLQFPRVGVHHSTLYNPNVIKNITGMTKAEKKAFHQNLFQAQENGGVPQDEGRLRAPQTQSFVHQTHRRPAPPPGVKPAPIFLTSKQNLPNAGVGRGSAVPRTAMDPDISAIIMAIVGRGAPGVQQCGVGNVSSTSSSTESQDEETTNEPQTVEQKKREEKKLQKKLRQIQQLEDKQDMGEELSEEEQQKIAKREEIEMALKCLSLD